jgi:signal transduction histidine kinase
MTTNDRSLLREKGLPRERYPATDLPSWHRLALWIACRKRRRTLASVVAAFLGLFVPAAESAGQVTEPYPARIVTEYALTVVRGYDYVDPAFQDPADWKLLGSNDGGQKWKLLDVQTNQVFAGRSERRAYPIKNEAAYNAYRLQVDRSRSSLGGVQLAELELIGKFTGAPEGTEPESVITASQEHPLLGPGSNAFDHDPLTSWQDYGLQSTNGAWLQCQYVTRAETVVTNLHQILVLGRRSAMRDSLAGKGAEIRSQLDSQTSQPLRTLIGYALTSGNDSPERDPRDWQLLGSNDRGKTWQMLDTRSGETFSQRIQRRSFRLKTPATFALYRLRIDSVRVPGEANSIQLAEIEPLCLVEATNRPISVVACAQGENPPMEAVEMLFDGDTRTKWLDFCQETNIVRSSWVQWQYLAGEYPAVINLNSLRAVRREGLPRIRLDLEGVVVSWTSSSRTLGLLDRTGFQLLRLAESKTEPEVETRVRLTGQIQFTSEPPLVSELALTQLGALPVLAAADGRVDLGPNPPFAVTEVEGVVTSVDRIPSYCTIRLATRNGGRWSVRIPNVRRAITPHCENLPVRVGGIVEKAFSADGEPTATVLWARSLEQVTLAFHEDQDWNQAPRIPIARLAASEAPIAFGDLVCVSGNLVSLDPGKSLVVSEGTNQVLVYTAQATELPAGNPIDAIGFLDQGGPVPKLRFGCYRARPSGRVVNTASQSPLTAPPAPAASISEIWNRARQDPGKPFHARIRGIITFIELGLTDAYLQDAHQSIVIRDQRSAGLSPYLRQEGSYVELEGTADGWIPPAISPSSFVQFLGKGSMPPPVRHSWEALTSGQDDGKWAEIEGIVRGVDNHRLDLMVNGGRLQAWINELDPAASERLLVSKVRVDGVCSAITGSRGQRLGTQLLVPSLEFIEVLERAPQRPFDIRATPLSQVMKAGFARVVTSTPLVKIAGVVTHSERNWIFVQEAVDGVRVALRKEGNLAPGDRVEVVGLVEQDDFSTRILQALVRKVGQEALPAPIVLDLFGANVVSRDSVRVELEGTLTGAGFRGGQQLLEVKESKTQRTFCAFLPAQAAPWPLLPPGSQLRLQGVFQASRENTEPEQTITGFELFLNSAADITILRRAPWWTTRHTLWVLAGLGTVLGAALAWAGLLRTEVGRRTLELHEEIAEHKRTEARLEDEIQERKRMEQDVEKTHKELVAASRQAGMAEVATSVLHNVGNVLNSVNVSATLVSNQVRKSKSANLVRVVELLRKNATHLTQFLASDPRGRQLPDYLAQLSEHLSSEQSSVLDEIQSLKKNIDHIKDVVAMQQTYARVSGVTEKVQLADLMEDALRINQGARSSHNVRIVREYEPQLPDISIDKHRLLQVLVNLIRNAIHACTESEHPDKRLVLSVSGQPDGVRISIKDNGVGIPAENLTRIFSHGFTTRKDGHGFGLHSAALAAKEMGGTLSVQSDGPGQGATFTLELPFDPARPCAPPPSEANLAA